MKKLFYLAMLAVLWSMAGCSSDYDDTMLIGRVENLEYRVEQLETLCKEINADISSLKGVVNALNDADFITGVTPVVRDGKTVGYTLTFKKNSPITIYHGEKGDKGDKGEQGEAGQNGQDGKPGADGKPGQDGKDGYVPQIGVKKDVDGIYYWTVDGDWLLDTEGKKVSAEGKPGPQGPVGPQGETGPVGPQGPAGQNGQDGKPGADGKDGITPKLKIENDKWYVSYNEGATWIELGSAVGSAPVMPDRVFEDVQITDKEIILVTKNGNFSIPRYQGVGITFNADEQGIKAGATIRVPYTLTNATATTKVSVASDGNYKVKLEGQTQKGGTIVVTAPTEYTDGYINVLLSEGTAYTSLHVISFYEWKMTVSGQTQGDRLVYSAPAAGTVINIPLSVNFDYDLVIPQEAQSWVSTAVQSRAAVRNENIQLTVQPNTALSARSCAIRVMPKGSQTAYMEIVVQQASTVFSIDCSHFVAKSGGETFTVTMKSTNAVKVEVPSDATWLTTDLTSAGETYTLKLTVANNTTTQIRTTKLNVRTADGATLLTTINVSQLAANADKLKDLVFVVSANALNDYTVYLPVCYDVNKRDINCIIDWGDGTIEHINGQDIPSIFDTYSVNIKHTYAGLSQDKEFEVRVSGHAPNLWYYGDNVVKGAATLIAVKQWGQTDLKEVLLSGLTGLKSICTDDLGAFVNVKSISFRDCVNLQNIPEGLFDYCKNVRHFRETFRNCPKIKSIPAGLFKNCPNAVSFELTFADCRLTSLPEGLFNNCVNAVSFQWTFQDNKNLASIPPGLFKNCAKVVSFNSTFSRCSSLTNIPEGLFKDCVNIEDMGSTFVGCPLQDVPVSIFDTNRKIIDFSSTFAGCPLKCESPYTMVDGKKVHLYEREQYFPKFAIPSKTSDCFGLPSALIDRDNIPNSWK